MKGIFILSLIAVSLFAQTWTEFPGNYSEISRTKLIRLDSSITFAETNSSRLYTHNTSDNSVNYKDIVGQLAYSGIYHFSEMFYPQYRKIPYGANYYYAKVGNDTLSVCTAIGYIRFDAPMFSAFNKQSEPLQNEIISYAYTNEPYFVNNNIVLIGTQKGIYELTYSDAFREIVIENNASMYIREIIKVNNDYYAFGRKYDTDTTSDKKIYVYKSIGNYENFDSVKTFNASMIHSFNYNPDSTKCYFVIEDQDKSKLDRGVWQLNSGSFNLYIASDTNYITALSVTDNELLVATTNNVNTNQDKLKQYFLKKLRNIFDLPGSVTQIIRNNEYVYTHYHRTTDLFPNNTAVLSNPKYTVIPMTPDTRFLPFRRAR